MKIDAISDTHTCCRISELKFSDAEILIIAGDLAGNGCSFELRAVLQGIDDVPHKHVVLVPGNHDGMFQEYRNDVPETRAKILIDDIVEIEGIRIGGSPYTPEFCGWFFMKDDKDLAPHWDIFKGQNLDVLVTHGPAYGILDDNDRDQRCGSKTLLEALPVIAPKYHIFGHIHNDFGSHKEMGIEFRNVSIVNEQYIQTNPVTTIEV